MPFFKEQWGVIAESVRGANHIRAGLPNQDHCRALMDDLIVVAIADGHGSSKSCRSDVGSQLATAAATRVIQEFFRGDWDSLSAHAFRQEIERQLPVRIVAEWQKQVREHLHASPLSEQEWAKIDGKSSEQEDAERDETPFIAYGSTLLCVAITKSFIVFLQVGDGDIICISPQRDVERPILVDERHFANLTTSLCSTQAVREVQIKAIPVNEPPPAVILLSTDGYSNSFRDETSFQQAGVDFAELLKTPEGAREVQSHLAEWLTDSASMSGDDVTVGLIFLRSDLLERMTGTTTDPPETLGRDTTSLSATHSESVVPEIDSLAVPLELNPESRLSRTEGVVLNDKDPIKNRRSYSLNAVKQPFSNEG